MSGYNEPGSYAGAPAGGSSAVAAATEAIDLEPASGASFFRSDYKKASSICDSVTRFGWSITALS